RGRTLLLSHPRGFQQMSLVKREAPHDSAQRWSSVDPGVKTLGPRLRGDDDLSSRTLANLVQIISQVASAPSNDAVRKTGENRLPIAQPSAQVRHASRI